MCERLLKRARCIVATGHRHHELWLARRYFLPRQNLRVLARQAQQVLAARELDPLWRPVARNVERVEPLQGADSPPRSPPDREPHTVDPPRRASDQLTPPLA